MDKKAIISWAIILITMLAICYLISRIFSGGKSTNQDLVNQLLAAKDSIIVEKNIRIKERDEHIIDLKNDYQILQERDSATAEHSAILEKQYKQLNDKLHNISDRIVRASSNNDSLRNLLSREF